MLWPWSDIISVVHRIVNILKRSGVFRLSKSLDAPSLQNISVTVKSHQLLTVIGPVGAGKVSALLWTCIASGSRVKWFGLWRQTVCLNKRRQQNNQSRLTLRKLSLFLHCSHVHIHPLFPTVIPAERHLGRAASRLGDAEGGRSAHLFCPAALGVPWNHPQ